MKKIVYLSILLTAFCFSTLEIAIKLAEAGLDPLQETFLRFAIGGLLLLPLALRDLRRRHTRITAGDWAYMLLLGVLCIPLSMLLLQLGVERSNASTASVLICTTPIPTLLLCCLFQGETLSWKKILILALGLAGLLLMIRPWDIQEGNTVAGVLLCIASAVIFSVYGLLSQRAIRRVGVKPQASFSFLLGSLVLLVMMLAMRRPVLAGVAENWGLVLYLGVVVTACGYYFYFLAIRWSDPATASIAFFIKPCVSPLLAVWVLGESLLWNSIAGIACIVLASYLNFRVKHQELSAQPPRA